MSFPSIPSADDDLSWLNDPLVISPQSVDFFRQQDAASDLLSSTEIPSLDVSSGPSIASPTRYSASPSPISFPPSPLVATDPYYSLPLAYLNLNSPSVVPQTSSAESMSTAGPFAQTFEGLGFSGERCYSLTSQVVDRPMTASDARAQSTSSCTLPGLDVAHGREYDSSGQNSSWSWSDDATKQPRDPHFQSSQGGSYIQTAMVHDLVHPHSPQHHTIHWHPYNRQPTQSVHPLSPLVDSYRSHQVSAPSSPVMSSPASSVEHSFWSSIHRRALSAGQADEFDRRFSEGDLVGHLVPDFSMSMSFDPFLSPTTRMSSSLSSPSQNGRGMTFSNSSSSTSLSASADAPSTAGSTGSPLSATVGVYRCEYEGCTKSFSRPYNLNSHIRTHTKLRPFKCDHCDRQFARLHDKNRHERLHRGVRPFACERCQHQFARMDALNRHLKIEGGRNLCNMFLIQNNSPNAMPLVDLPPKKINPLILAHFPNFGQESKDDKDLA